MGEDKPISPEARISVVVTTIERDSLDSTLASIYNQENLVIKPEIIKVVDTERKGHPWAVNEGLRYVQTPYVFLCDDDVVLRPDALEKLLEALYYVPEAGYAYGDYEFTNHPTQGDGVHKAIPFDPDFLLDVGNYISTMSLVRTRHLRAIGGMPDVPYLQDWEMWKKLLENGICGVYVPGILFSTNYTEGITADRAAGL